MRTAGTWGALTHAGQTAETALASGAAGAAPPGKEGAPMRFRKIVTSAATLRGDTRHPR